MRFGAVDGCPVPAPLVPEIIAIKKKSGATLVSCDRSKEAEPILRKYGKKSQPELYADFLAGRGNPANKPGQSTHERHNDGVAYPGPVGMPLRYWQVGQDWDIPHVQAVVKAAHDLGFTATVTYPTSTRERQHVNFRKEPTLKALFRSLKRGQTSRRVGSIRKSLEYVRDPESKTTYLKPSQRPSNINFFDASLEAALKAYQDDHGQHVDGVYGLQTARQLAASVRFRKRKDKETK